MPMDPLSDVLSLLRPRSYAASGFCAGGDWSVRFPRHEGIKCYAVVANHCWLSLDGVPEAVALGAGDCFLLPSGRPFRLASDLTLASLDAAAVFPSARRGGIALCNGGGDFRLVGSHFTFAHNPAGLLLGMLPPIVHIREPADRETLRWSVEHLMQELHDPKPGGALVADHLAHLMLVQALRVHLAERMHQRVGWLFALADKQISAAINAMHEEPGRAWTLHALGRCAGISRSSFALRFKATVGVSAMDYLTRWRMLVAGERLVHSRERTAVIASSLGYEPESAFSTAFRRVMGCSPRQYGRTHGTSAEPAREREVSAPAKRAV
jgi:AraC-like DNA-binding protein